MKKLFAILFFILVPVAVQASDLSPKDLIFEQDTSGKYIYCNNIEFIYRDNLADTSNPNPKYIMNNDLTAGKYSFFASHVNHTELRDADGNMTEAGFDIELDVEFKAKQDTVITVRNLGFEVPENIKYYYNGKSYTYEEAWGCLNAWASYKRIPIRQIDSGKTYKPIDFEPLSIKLSAGETFYLSSIIPNYCAVPFYRPVHLLADFDVSDGDVSCNVCAFKSWGELGNRDNVASNIGYGIYQREKQYKGIADCMNSVSVELNYSIDDWVGGDTYFPVKVYNQYAPGGNAVNKWFTHLNPAADPWSKTLAAASDMLSFKYRDPSKKTYYGPSVKDNAKDDIWCFDIYHSDTSAYPGKDSGINRNSYKPNYELNTSSPEIYACNLGNYGVSVNYKYTIENTGEVTRFVVYNLNTTANNIVILRDENGNMVNEYALCKGSGSAKSNDTMACIELPGKSVTTFYLEVILPTNYVGGMENSLILKDAPVVIPVYENAYQEVKWDYSWTGKEFIKWDNGKLYLSDDMVNWNYQPLTDEVEEIFHDNWSEYRFMYADGGYVVKPCIYDAVPYYGVREYFRNVYFLNADFTLKKTVEFNRYPTDMSYAKGNYYITAGSRYKSSDMQNWELTDSSSSMPVDNGGRYSVYTKNGSIYISSNGVDYSEVIFNGKKPLFVECLGDIYYSIDKNTIMVSGDGINWDEYTFDERVELVRRIGSKILVNGKYEVEYSPKNILSIMFDGRYIAFENEPVYADDGSASVAASELSKDLSLAFGENNSELIAALETMNADDSDMFFVKNGIKYVKIRKVCESLGFSVSYSDETELVTIKK